ncbi:SDR family oxidoreductase [Sporolactobacillus shoreicorticis]|uniref:SDR family NAD(P)-dependent oxidoreductase n=1 Tax=Sporolactobacillus shoreicorticis TaxID=1923877 RepID=A0ABW5S978_9BACL|nr:SDR family oxidoreductase [Sporolactobacillus shoreicorticis]MCO7125758.1 SDR family oxidoreductase [Sporolactobacillus shoreicorticis]
MKKTALVTGASSGIGNALAERLATDHYDLILVARSKEKMEAMKAAWPALSVTVITKDLSKPGAAKEVYDEVKQIGLNVDLLINDAGFGLVGAFQSLPIERQSNMIQLNCTALTELTYYFLPDLRSSSGKIMNVASTAAYQPGPFMAVYFASKAYVLSLSEALSEELSGSGVTVTALCPGPTHTQFGAVAHAENIKMFSHTMDVAAVASIGYRALMKGKQVAITGSLNYAGAIAAKLLPRNWGAKAVRMVTKPKKK